MDHTAHRADLGSRLENRAPEMVESSMPHIFEEENRVAEKDHDPDYAVRLELGTHFVRQDMLDGILTVQGVLGDGYSVALSRELREIIRMRGKAPLKVLLFSGGGGVYPAFYIYDTLRNYSQNFGPVTVVTSGIAASAAAAIVLQAGDDRQITPRGRLMLHEVGQWFMHDTAIAASAAEDSNREMRTLQTSVCEVLGERTHHTASFWQDVIARKEMWYSAEQALELGLVDKITTTETAILGA